MACQICLCAGFFVVIILLCWTTSGTKNDPYAKVTLTTDKDIKQEEGTRYVRIDSDEQHIMRPPIVGPPLGEYPMAPASRYDERKFMELPRGGLSCPNKRWYDSIYNGGAETILDAPGVSKTDVQSLWHEDAQVRRRETRVARAIVPKPHGMMV